MSQDTRDKKIARMERFMRLVDALEAAQRHDLHRTALFMTLRLLEMGCWLDDVGDWREDTRPMKPIAGLPDGTWADNHDEF